MKAQALFVSADPVFFLAIGAASRTHYPFAVADLLNFHNSALSGEDLPTNETRTVASSSNRPQRYTSTKSQCTDLGPRDNLCQSLFCQDLLHAALAEPFGKNVSAVGKALWVHSRRAGQVQEVSTRRQV